jgi:pimeloyl-ACP methyl ester carboxylesterase
MPDQTPTDREIVRRFESAQTPEALAHFLVALSPEESRALRVYLGVDGFRRLYLMAQKLATTRALRTPEGNVVVVPGIMGSELTAADVAQHQTLVWLSIPRIYAGWLSRLQLAADGESQFDPAYTAFATNVLNKYYGELVLQLSQRWKARAFWYDWRKSLSIAADDLERFLRREFQDQPVNVVAHSMGGLVTRTLLLKAPTTAAGDPLVSRLVMLGTPNFGSFEVPQIFAGIQDSVRQMIRLMGGLSGLLNSEPARRRLLEILASFPAIYQMLPLPDKVSDEIRDAVDSLYLARTYAPYTSVSTRHLEAAQTHHERLNRDIGNQGQLVYVAGYGELTAVGLTNADKLDDPASYVISTAGDGRVPHSLGVLPNVQTYYVHGPHGDLARNPEVLRAIDDLVSEGTTRSLAERMPEERGARVDAKDLHAKWARRFAPEVQQREDAAVQELVRRLDRRLVVPRGGDILTASPPDFVASDERELEERVAGAFLGSPAEHDRPDEPQVAPPKITLRLVHADIVNCHETVSGLPIDAIAGGFYSGLRPQGGVKALDKSVSDALPIGAATGGSPTARLLLSELIERGTIRGDLGAPFLLPDPREGGAGRVIALVGLGTPGCCGVPELALTIRELCWTLNGSASSTSRPC